MIAFLIPLVAVAACGTSADEPLQRAVAAADTVEIREWTVPWANTRPRDPIVDAEGRVWFVGQRGNYLGMLDPETGEPHPTRPAGERASAQRDRGAGRSVVVRR